MNEFNLDEIALGLDLEECDLILMNTNDHIIFVNGDDGEILEMYRLQ